MILERCQQLILVRVCVCVTYVCLLTSLLGRVSNSSGGTVDTQSSFSSLASASGAAMVVSVCPRFNKQQLQHTQPTANKETNSPVEDNYTNNKDALHRTAQNNTWSSTSKRSKATPRVQSAHSTSLPDRPKTYTHLPPHPAKSSLPTPPHRRTIGLADYERSEVQLVYHW